MNASHKEHKIETLHDIFMLSEDEFQRFLPDLMQWYAAAHATVEFLECEKSEFVASMRWIDDGEHEIKEIDLNFTDGTSLNLLDPNTWPTQENK